MDTSDFAMADFLRTFGWVALGMAVVLVITYLSGRIAGRHSVIDSAWGLLFAAAAVISFVSSAGIGDGVRRWLLLTLTVIWGVRLAVHMTVRSWGKGEDPRYAEWLRDRGQLQAVFLVYVLQGVLALVICTPVVLGMFLAASITPAALIGIAIWVLGFVFESVGDWQLQRFRSRKAAGVVPKGAIMDLGLWRYTRHPNYFGDACVWTGLFLITADRWPGVLTAFAPALMIYLLAFGSGKRVLETTMRSRPGYAAYASRTSGFLPLPPRRGSMSRRFTG
jgi:steroid 5-alpha reductase family enzyme